ncbi:hypothetical protein Tco_0962062 [Tanacetum coccineum]
MPVCNAPKMAFMEMANNFEELLMGKETNMNDVLGMQDNPEHQNTRHKDVSCHGNAEQAKIQITFEDFDIKFSLVQTVASRGLTKP